jgi:hypothetical protein
MRGTDGAEAIGVGNVPSRSLATAGEAKRSHRLDAPSRGLNIQAFAGRFVGADFGAESDADMTDASASADTAEAVDEIGPASASRPRPLPRLASLDTGPSLSLPPVAPAVPRAMPTLPSVADLDGRTAVYDIAGHTVYLPDGQKLEAHSGIGPRRDDPRFVKERNRGPTPPNIYELSLRERPFHGVRALRLTPVGDGKMYGRDGILAHTYMLGSKGQSNGCMVMRDYPAFLNAYLSGKIERVIVVDHLSLHDRRVASLL